LLKYRRIFMRTSEAPDAGAARLCASRNRGTPRFSPLTLAVATTAFLAAGLFILQDIARTYGDAHRELNLLGKSVFGQQVRGIDTALDSVAARLNAASRAGLVNGVASSNDPLSLSIPSENLVTLASEREHGALMAGVAGRGAAALGLA